MTIGLGYEANGNVVGFILGGGGGSKPRFDRVLPADHLGTTNEKVSMIRGGGQRGRSGFAPGEALPPTYAGYKTDLLLPASGASGSRAGGRRDAKTTRRWPDTRRSKPGCADSRSCRSQTRNNEREAKASLSCPSG